MGILLRYTMSLPRILWTQHPCQYFTNEVDNMTTAVRRGLSIPQLSAMYGISEGLLYRLANEGNLPGCRLLGGDTGRGRFLVHIETFEAWLSEGHGREQDRGP